MKPIVIHKKATKYADYIRIWVCCFLMPINIYSEYLEKITGVGTLVFNIVSFAIFVFLALPKIIGNCKIEKKLGFIFCTIFFLVVLHMVIFGNYINELKQLSFVIEFLIVATLYNEDYFDTVKKTIIIISIIMSIDIFVNLPKLISKNYNLFNVRQYTMLDKPYYTLIFPLAIIFLVSTLMHAKSKHRIKIISLIVILCAVLFGILESKTALVATLIAIFIILSRNKKRRKYLYLGLILFALFAAFYFGVFRKKLPDLLMSVVYYFRGQYDVLAYAYAQSYFIRFEIVGLAFRTFLAHPIIGCGFNNYYNFVSARGWQNYSKGITDIESDALAIFAEGGIVYTAVIVSVFVFLFKKLIAKKEYLKTNKFHTLDALGCLICLVIAIIGNDFMSSFYWCMLGVVYGCAIKKQTYEDISFGGLTNDQF